MTASDHVEPSQVLKNSFRDTVLHLSKSCICLMKRFIISPHSYWPSNWGEGCFPLFLWIGQLTAFILAGSLNPCEGRDKHRKGEGRMGQKALPMVESYELVDQKSSPGFKRLWYYSWTRWLPQKEHNCLLSPKIKSCSWLSHPLPSIQLRCPL